MVLASALRSSEFGLLCLGLIGSYLIHGYLSEYLFRLEGFHFGGAVALFQSMSVSLLGLSNLIWTKGKVKITAPIFDYAVLGTTTVSALATGTAALSYVSYATQTLFKSCKIVPVMLGSIIMLRRKFCPAEYAVCAFVVTGLISFNAPSLIKRESSGSIESDGMSSSLHGILLCLFSLSFDAVYANLQERMLSYRKIDFFEALFMTNAVGSAALFVFLLVDGGMVEAVVYLANSGQATVVLLGMCALSLTGQTSALMLVKKYGAFAVGVLTSSRKALSILLSLVVFPQAFTLFHAGGLLLVGSGVGVEMVLSSSPHLLPGWWRGEKKSGFDEVFDISKLEVGDEKV
mmetsp:Transcript_38051/g.98242  ORF Transcript_38051/g.98242 Transcript_38051/m.98242 type:complete len:346 (-) Transcript_38051:96-1133(-)